MLQGDQVRVMFVNILLVWSVPFWFVQLLFYFPFRSVFRVVLSSAPCLFVICCVLFCCDYVVGFYLLICSVFICYIMCSFLNCLLCWDFIYSVLSCPMLMRYGAAACLCMSVSLFWSMLSFALLFRTIPSAEIQSSLCLCCSFTPF